MGRDIELLSEPAAVSMADQWYQFASADHFWMQWRMATLCSLLSGIDIGPRPIEIGCGNAAALAQLEACFGVPICGIDLNLPALELAKPVEGPLYVYNVYDRRPDWQHRFTTAFLLDTLEHIDAPVPFLEAIRDHLGAEGLLVVNVPALQSLYSVYDEVAGHVKRYNLHDLQAELNAAGFQVMRRQYWGLTMLPIAAVRKFLLKAVDRNSVIERGFRPPNRFAERVLRGLMHVERRLVRRPWLGTSLAVVAQVAEHQWAN